MLNIHKHSYENLSLKIKKKFSLQITNNISSHGVETFVIIRSNIKQVLIG